ncbi:hypothetical protein N7478_012376 [Penicillium angulare]|uniref:uncharacterized protein n=1 Tax=Penicillium angulare TaxID=116970 RepID=UPI0025402057|nr:uncharacterized protein N7478_012376 [Penicillium angulare]KAJ5259395.1 hypothetical protein N7478_012376 [Penicillium angulare]
MAGNNNNRLIRKDVENLTEDERDKLVFAFYKLQQEHPGMPSDLNENSFYVIAGYHGQPFRGGGDVAIPYWNEFMDAGVPCIFTQKTYTFSANFPKASDINRGDIKSNDSNGVTIDNPLFSYRLQQGFYDKLARTSTNGKGTTKRIDYSKHKDYETTNVKAWLFKPSSDNVPVPGMSELYMRAAKLAPNYTVFSNTTSAAKWNDDNFAGQDYSKTDLAVALEKPHNGVHLAVGGYSLPNKDLNRPTFAFANGDMGENDTAAFDPIFFFHHCFVDYVFWLWQKNYGATEKLTIIDDYPGTSPIDNQGPTPFTPADSRLSMETPLVPFKNDKNIYLKSEDVVNIREYGYDYQDAEPPSPIPPVLLPPQMEAVSAKKAWSGGDTALPVVRLSGISRAHRQGSFVVGVWAKPKKASEEKNVLVGIEPVFSRWHVPSCANCRNTLELTTHMELPPRLEVHKENNTTLAKIEPAERLEHAKELEFTIRVLENTNRDASGDKKPTIMEFAIVKAAEHEPSKAWNVPDNTLDLGPTIEVMPAIGGFVGVSYQVI